MKSINSLSDQCLLTIFDRIPLDDLTRIGQVCSRWYSLEKNAFARRHHLSLFIYSEKPKPESKPGIQLKVFHHSTIQKVIDLFPEVTSLTIEHEIGRIYINEFNDSSLDPLALTNLLTHQWSSKLVSLKLEKTYQIFRDANVTPIIEAINNLAALKRLSLLHSFNYNSISISQFRIISQLEEFFFRTDYHIDQNELILKYAKDSAVLRRIEMVSGDIGFHSTKVHSLLNLSPQLAAKFTRLHSSRSNDNHFLEIDNRQLAQFCLHFSSLQKIYIGQCGKSSYTKRLTCLSPLKRLTYLGLELHKLDKIKDMSYPMAVEPLKSVTKLTLSMIDHPDKTIKFMNSFNFVYLFPKLEFVDIEYNYYGNNDSVMISDDDDFFDFEEEVMTNEQLRTYLIEPLKKCEYLKQIDFKTGGFEAKWTRADSM